MAGGEWGNRAWDETLQRPVAIKRVRADALDNELARQRFLREATSAAQLNHPAIVQIFHILRHDERDHIVMELVDGRDLSQDLEEGPLPWKKALPLFLEICEALEQAHGQDIVHRDLKIDNVMITAQGHAKILDFGLAKSLRPGATPLSVSGQVMGTLHTMSPEQARGEAIDHRTDLFSLGALFYEVLTGIAPFRAETARETLGKVCGHHPPAVRSLRKDVPDALSELIVELLQKNPTRRPQHAGEMAHRLWQCFEASGQEAGGIVSSPSNIPTVRARPAAQRPWLSGDSALGADPATVPRRAGRWGIRWPRSWVWVGLLILLAVGLGSGALWLDWHQEGGPVFEGFWGKEAEAPPSIAVLGLDSSQDLGHQWFTALLGEMLASELGTLDSVRVASRDEVVRARRELNIEPMGDLDLNSRRRLGRLLDVDYLVEIESLGEASGMFRLGLQFYDVRKGHMFVDLDANSPPSHPDAARFYHEGLERWRVLDMPEAVRLFEEAVTTEPEHPMPYIALAEAQRHLGAEQEATQMADEAIQRIGLLPEASRLELTARGHAVAQRWDEAAKIYGQLHAEGRRDLDLGLRLAEAQIEVGDISQAAQILEELARLPTPVGEDPRIDLAWTRVHHAQGDFSAMLVVADRLIRRCRDGKTPLLLAQGLVRRATALRGLGEQERIQESLKEARTLFDTFGDPYGAAKVLEHMAHGEWERGDLRHAERLFKEVHQEHLKLGNVTRAAVVQGYLAAVLESQGRLVEAFELYETALQEIEEAGDELHLMVILGNLGGVYMFQGEWDRAQELLLRAADIARQLGDIRTQGFIQTNLAEIAYIQGDLETAKNRFQQSLAGNVRLDDQEGRTYDRMQLARVMAANGDLEAARHELLRAKQAWASLKDKVGVAETESDLALVALLLGQVEEAETLARRAEEILRYGQWNEAALIAQSILVRSLLAQDLRVEAREEAESLRKRAMDSEDVYAKQIALVAVARVDVVGGADVAQVIQQLEQISTEANASGYLHAVYEARLAAGEIELIFGQPEAARKRLDILRQEAMAKGFGQIVDRVDATLSRSGLIDH